ESPGRAVRVRPAERRDELRLALAAEPGVADLVDDGAALAFRFSGDDAALAALLARVVARGLPVLEFHLIHAGLEDVFLRATQGRLQ
ncbi:MAG TPA: ABC transporter ATP-binding protein, partial [Planctomycetota bacterium]|nr:ABC transporter ATP-binding protein [Planctomycetota bacterium]